MTVDQVDYAQVWARVVQDLDSAGIAPRERAFLRLTRFVGMLDSTALLAVPYAHTKDTLETSLRLSVSRSLSQSLDRDVRLAVTVDEELRREVEGEGTGTDLIPTAAIEQEISSVRPETGARDTEPRDSRRPLLHVSARPGATGAGLATTTDGDSRLNPKYTFDTFVSGSSNRFAHAASLAVAEAPARAYNPLFIYGESGLGKTHLLHAIGHYARNLIRETRVRYVNSEEFTNDFINLVHAGRAEDFRRRYRDVDLLLVDDVQFLERAERTQEEFFHTFNTLHNANKQIVISSDRPPKQLTTLEDRLRTRFEWGLITDVQAPDLETRIAILRKKVAGDVLPEVAPEVLEYIASKIQTNIRELEGALIRVNAYASLNRTDVSIGLAEEVLRDLLPDTEGPKITATIIMSVTAEYFNVTVDDLKGHSRSRVLVTARQIAMYLCRELTELSLPRIGQIFGGKDHTTVMHAVRKISALMAERLQIFNQVTELTSRIKARARQ